MSLADSLKISENMRRGLSLVRASSSSQVGKNPEDELPAQSEMIRKYAEESGFEIVREVAESAVSAYKNTSAQREKIQLIKAMAKRKEFDVLLIFHSNRLGRLALDTPDLIDWFYRHGIRVFSVSEGELASNNPTDVFMNQVRSFQADNESFTKVNVISQYHMNMVENGVYRGGSMIPLGYKLVDRGSRNFKGRLIYDYIIDEIDAEIVKRIYDLSTNMNYGQSRIAQLLNKENVPTKRSGTWHSSTIQGMLNNVMYKGIFKYKSKNFNRTVFSNIVDELVIIPEELWEQNQKAMRDRTYKKKDFDRKDMRTSKNTYGKMLLNGLAFCGSCGMSLTTMTAYKVWETKDGVKHKKSYYKYRCSSFYKSGGVECKGQKTHGTSKVEPIVIEETKNFILGLQGKNLTESFIEQLEKNVLSLQRKKRELTDKLEKSYKKKTSFQEEYGDAILEKNKIKQKMLEEMMETNYNNIVEYNKSLETIDGEIVMARADKINYIELGDDFDGWSERFDGCDMETKRNMLSKVIDKITVYDDEVVIDYSVTIETFLENSVGSQTEQMVRVPR